MCPDKNKCACYPNLCTKCIALSDPVHNYPLFAYRGRGKDYPTYAQSMCEGVIKHLLDNK